MPTVEELQTQVEKLTQQVQGLSAERNTYRQQLNGYERLMAEVDPSSLQRDAQGYVVGWAAPAATDHPSGARLTGHPFAGLVDDPSTADAWAQQQAKALIAQQGFITKPQLQQLLQESYQRAYQTNRMEGLIWRGVDRLASEEKFKPLSDYSSAFSKKVAEKLQVLGLGKPMVEKPESFATDWQYQITDAARPWLPLQQAAEIAWAEQQAQSQQSQQAQQTGQAAQQAAGLSPQTGQVASGGVGTQVQQLIGQNAPPEQVAALLDAFGT